MKNIILLSLVTFISFSCELIPAVNPNGSNSNIILNDIDCPNFPNCYDIDIDGDGTFDYSYFDDICEYIWSGSSDGVNSNVVLAQPNLRLVVLNYGQVINANYQVGIWHVYGVEQNNISDSSCPNVNAQNVFTSLGSNPGYVAVRFTIDNNYHNGWIEFIEGIPRRAAYNAIPGQGLRAGQVD